MGLENAIEPLIIASILTTSAIVNRTRDRGDSKWWSLLASPSPTRSSSPRSGYADDSLFDPTSPLIRHRSSSPPTRGHGIEDWLPYPDTRCFHNYPFSRFLRKFPFLIEIWYWALTYWPYQLMRARAALYISANPTREAEVLAFATDNARRILSIEQKLGLAIEEPLQNFLLTKCRPWVMAVLCRIYLAHIAVGIAFLGYGYTYFPRDKYQRVRRNVGINNWLAFVVLTLYRCTPPRLMPASYNFVDVLHPGKGPGNDWNNNRFKLTLAAMPSLHFGTALLIGCSVAVWGKFKPVRMLAPLYPLVMGFVVIATANHWVLDCVAGVLVVYTGWNINWVLLALRPIEEWLFWLLRTEKPKDELVVAWKGDDED